ncbi:MAG TPA: cation:proton antiporter [Ktedonobacterales bacterium]|nr:cation:proton antiporter [Ktedonobacterales bacterium]
MAAEFHLILNIAIAVTAALIGGLIAHRLHQSVIVGYLLAGIALGPFTPGFVGDRERISELAEIGVVFLMFALGIEFSLKELARVRQVALIGTSVQVLLLIAAGYGLGALLGWPPSQALFFGGVISISSTMVILKTLLDRGEVASSHGRALLGMLIVQDLAVVLLIVLLPRIAMGSDTNLLALALILGRAAAFIAAVLFLGTRVVPRIMARVERLRSPELFLLTAVALALGTAAISALLGLSPALGAFLGGLLLTESEFDHRVIAEVVPMRNLFATLFFVSIGMLINPSFIARNLLAVIGLALFIVAAKALITLGAILPFRLGARTILFTSLGMVSLGEFSYVLAQAGLGVGAISTDLYSLILAASVLTILLTPLAFQTAPILEGLLERVPAIRRYNLAHQALWNAEEEMLRGHAIIAGYGRVGSYVTQGLSRGGLPVTVIEQDMHLVQQVRDEGIPVVYGDASSPTILAAAHPERARLIVVALPDSGATREVVRNARSANPDAPILARIAREEDEEGLRRIGVTQVIAPESAGALLLLELCLQAAGMEAVAAEGEPAERD